MSAANMFYGQKKPVNTADILSRSATASPAASQEPQHKSQVPAQSAFSPPPPTSAGSGGVVSGPWNGSLGGGGEVGAIPSISVMNTGPATTWNGRDAAAGNTSSFMENATSNTSSFMENATGARPQIQKQKSTPRPGAILTGKQEHYLKRELLGQQTQYEINELNSPTALRRFGAPFRSDVGEVSPEDSELPILRYIFVKHVRNFPFLDQAREKEFWQDRLQVFLESFATKQISSSEDRLEDTKRKKLAQKAEKVVELMMVSGIPTASGYEERIRFAEMEVVDRGANEEGVMVNVPEGRDINGWDVNVAGVRTVSKRRTVRQHQHAEFLIRVKERGQPERYVARRYGAFNKLRDQLKLEMPGKVLPPLPRKNKKQTGAFLGGGDDSDDDESIMSEELNDIESHEQHSPAPAAASISNGYGIGKYLGWGSSSPAGHRRTSSAVSHASNHSGRSTPRQSVEMAGQQPQQYHTLQREEQRVALRAYLRNFLNNEQIAKTKAMHDFLTAHPTSPSREEMDDIERRKEMDQRRIEEGRRFYEIARKRAQELDVHMEKFRREIVERNGLTKLFREIKEKNRIADLSPEYQKFAEWMRIEVAATIYHLFLAEDNSPELFAQFKRIHSLVPYVALKNVIRFANPAAVMKGVLDLFLAQPLGARSLLQRIFGYAISDGIKSGQKSLDAMSSRIDDSALCDKIDAYVNANVDLKEALRLEAREEDIDLMVVILRTERFAPVLDDHRIGRIFNAYVAWNNAVENVDNEMREGAELYAHLKLYLKLSTRHRDKVQMLSIIEEPVTLQLFRDLFTIFYEPLVRVYKSANVYSSVTDFASFADDAIKVVEAAQRQDLGTNDPNVTVQSFIDLCARHEDDFYKFVHEVHTHDNGLFDQLMGWLEGILEFLRKGPRSLSQNGGWSNGLDMNALLQGSVDMGAVDKDKCLREIEALVEWQAERKRWHHDKTRRKMAGGGDDNVPGAGGMAAGFSSSDFGISEGDIADLGLGESDAEDDRDEEDEMAEEDELAAGSEEAIVAERKRRKKLQEALRSRMGEPAKPQVSEVVKLREGFVSMLRGLLAE